MSQKIANIFNNVNLTAFKNNLVEAVKEAIGKFWEQDTEILFQAINDYREIRQEILIKNMDFFSSQIKVENHKPE